MDHPLRTISYIADIGNIVVLMARRRMPRPDTQENVEASDPGQESRRQYKMICHVFESEDVSSRGDAFTLFMLTARTVSSTNHSSRWMHSDPA